MDNDNETTEWLNEDGEPQNSLRLGIEFGVFEFDGVHFTLVENWRERIEVARKACAQSD
ncbi:Uncharacterised protein [Mycobacteroides abscessus subsp. massiliense]|uniref:hypothetical protein n=1 Tax=Mycobacteroides abscessus TaxID=36809 RepID=UPI0009D1B080|nr:hypothetical protein [Mycobacteroides abscessus]SLH95735.1 Uncharacterised protein [Mycobacteroides abscessus subsp. massiliense]SLI84295.1 Uncharacterised protein [Mycobacteroides abscessus subsp. massiliense]